MNKVFHTVVYVVWSETVPRLKKLYSNLVILTLSLANVYILDKFFSLEPVSLHKTYYNGSFYLIFLKIVCICVNTEILPFLFLGFT